MAKTILVVDDSPTELKLMTAALDGQGYRIITADNGAEALEVASKEKPDVVLLDVIMPELNGFQVCRQIKADDNTKNSKVILVTTKDQESDRFWGTKQGADDYVVKPFDPSNLLATVQKYA